MVQTLVFPGNAQGRCVVVSSVVDADEPPAGSLYAASDGGGAIGAEYELWRFGLNLEGEVAAWQPEGLLQAVAQQCHRLDLVGRTDLRQGQRESRRQRSARQQLR